MTKIDKIDMSHNYEKAETDILRRNYVLKSDNY